MNVEHTPKRIIVTSGPTRAYFDRIRYIANTSSGALGSKIAGSLVGAGFPVTHLFGTGSMTAASASPLYEPLETSTISDLVENVRKVSRRGDVGAVVHAMAVLDYAPERFLDEKKKSGDAVWDIRLVKTPKVVGMLRELMPDAYLIGFKLESGVDEAELVRRAVTLLETNCLDAVVANDLGRVGAERHEAMFVGPGGAILNRAESKDGIAAIVTELIKRHCAV